MKNFAKHLLYIMESKTFLLFMTSGISGICRTSGTSTSDPGTT